MESLFRLAQKREGQKDFTVQKSAGRKLVHPQRGVETSSSQRERIVLPNQRHGIVQNRDFENLQS